jgi:hypothetical protein
MAIGDDEVVRMTQATDSLTHPAKTPPAGWALVRQSASIALFLAVGWQLWDYPIDRWLLLVGLLAYAGALARWPMSWLGVLPAMVPGLELAHWSGRLFLEDIDILFLFTLACLAWRASPLQGESLYRWPRKAYVALALLLLSYAASLIVGLTPLPDWRDPNLTASFISPANALRQCKGVLWATLMAPFVVRSFREQPETARDMLLAGVVAGGIFTGIVALWERGVWQALIYGGTVWQILDPLTNFSTDYRVTGPFAEMNTGGEAIDGYLALTWPLLTLAVLLARRFWAVLLSVFALSLVIYALVTTFSRGLYFSLAIAGVAGLVGMVRVLATDRKTQQLHLLPMLALLIPAVVIAGYGYYRGGTLSMGAPIFAFAAAAWVSWRNAPVRLVALTLIVVGSLSTWATAHGMLTSKWQTTETLVAYVAASCMTALALLAGGWEGRVLPRNLGFKPYVLLMLVLVMGIGTLVPALLGYRMTERASAVQSDLSIRADHWKHALSIMNKGATDRILGMGLGSFPRAYYWDSVNAPRESGDFSLVRENGNTFVRTSGGKSLRLGQRLSVPANSRIRLTLDVRSIAPEAWLQIRLCRRFVIHPTEWNGECVSMHETIASTNGQWKSLSFEGDTGKVGDGAQWGRAPLMLEINNRREYSLMYKPPAIVDLDNISLKGADGREYVANGDFENGLDHWLPYYDFSHTPWHIKNIWVHLYFEQGLLGVLAFAWALIVGLLAGWQGASRGDRFAVGVAVALLSFVAVGTFGSPIDAPRIAWLYYFLMFVLFTQFRTAHPEMRQA